MIRRATLNDVAREAGVSIKTASRVLSGVETVNPTLRDKVQRAAAGLDYRPNRAARSLSPTLSYWSKCYPPIAAHATGRPSCARISSCRRCGIT